MHLRKVRNIQTKIFFEDVLDQSMVPFDDSLLERALTQWKFGDWQSLVNLNLETLQYHPDRAVLALLAGAGRLQMGLEIEGKQFLSNAKNWGVSKKLLIRVLIAGVHNSLGRAAALANQKEHANLHFQNSISLVVPGSDVRLIAKARIMQQYEQLGLSLTWTDI